jgi:hypothetical protein
MLALSLLSLLSAAPILDVRTGNVEVRDDVSGVVAASFAVNAEGPVAWDPARNRAIFVTTSTGAWSVKQVHLGTGAVTALGGAIGLVTDVEVDTFTGTVYWVERGQGIYAKPINNRYGLVLATNSAVSIEVDSYRSVLWYTLDWGSTLKRRSASGATTTVISLGASDFMTDFVIDEANSQIIWAQDGLAGQSLRRAAFNGSGVVTVRALSNVDPNNMCASYQLSLDDDGGVLYASCYTTLEKLVLATNVNTEIARISGPGPLFGDLSPPTAAPVARKAWSPVNPTAYTSAHPYNRATGFIIRPTAPVVVRRLGALITSFNNVRLWDNTTGQQVAQALVWGPNGSTPGWAYANITPIELVPGRAYTLSVDGAAASNNAFTWFPADFPNYPVASADIVFEDAVEGVFNNAPSMSWARPTVSLGGWMAAGIPDLEVVAP